MANNSIVILIGRDEETSCLGMMIQGKWVKDTSCILPDSVSRLIHDENRAHCRLTIQDNVIKITNLNPKNVTYVDGKEIKKTTIIDKHSIVELGVDQYRLRVNKLLKDIDYVPSVSIKHLKRVWDRYDRSLLKLQVQQQKAANQQKLQGIISQASILCVLIPSIIPSIPIPGVVRVILVAAALALGVYFYIKGSRTGDSFVIKKRELDERFKEDYVCPRCGYFFGFTSYENLEYKKNCPNPDCNALLTT